MFHPKEHKKLLFRQYPPDSWNVRGKVLLFAPLELKLDPVTSAGARAERRYDDTAGVTARTRPESLETQRKRGGGMKRRRKWRLLVAKATDDE